MLHWQVCLDFVKKQKRGGVTNESCTKLLFPGIMGSSNSSNTIKPWDSQQFQFPLCYKWWEFKAKTFMTQALTASLFSRSSANHWGFLHVDIHAQDHCGCHHHCCVHFEGTGWHHHRRSRSKRWERSVWGQSWLSYNWAPYPRASTNTQTLLWGDQEENYWLAPDPHWNHCGETLPQRDQR